jgi:hypothetical protein
VVRGQIIQIGSIWQPWMRPGILIPALAYDPLAWINLTNCLAHPFSHIGQ